MAAASSQGDRVSRTAQCWSKRRRGAAARGSVGGGPGSGGAGEVPKLLKRGLVAPPGCPRYPEMRQRVALPRISSVRPRGSLARERSLRLRLPRLPPRRTTLHRTAPHRGRTNCGLWSLQAGMAASARSGRPWEPVLPRSPSLGHSQSRPLGPWTSWPVPGKQSEPRDVARQKDSPSGAPSGR